MSKNLLLSACCLLAAVANVAPAKMFTPAEEEFMNRRRAVKRERVTIGTNEYWIVTYMKGAKPDGVKTNLAHKIEGVPQTNPTEEDAKRSRKAVKAAEKAAKKDSNNFEKWMKDTKKARDKSSADMAEFYDAILEIATGSVPNK